MEAPDQLDVHGSSSSTGDCPCPYPSVLAKRKRTKRPILKASSASPPLVAASSSTSSVDVSTATMTDEEEDMANCLILLAQGRYSSPPPPPAPPATVVAPPPPAEKFTSRKFTEATTTAGGKAGFYVYECKTCNKCFPSFQALGGHRASHKKPKMPIMLPTNDDDDDHIDMNNTTAAAITVPRPAANGDYNCNNNKTARVHECSICGAEFSSGQALGGHMRRHRPIGIVGPNSAAGDHLAAAMQQAAAAKKEQRRSGAALSLDLNLPAPSDDFSLNIADHNKQQQRPMVFSAAAGPAAAAAAALVDCHH